MLHTCGEDDVLLVLDHCGSQLVQTVCRGVGEYAGVVAVVRTHELQDLLPGFFHKLGGMIGFL